MAESDVYILSLILTPENLKVLSNNFQDALAARPWAAASHCSPQGHLHAKVALNCFCSAWAPQDQRKPSTLRTWLSSTSPQASEVVWAWEIMKRQRVRGECLSHQHNTIPRSSSSELKLHQPIIVNAFPEDLVPWYSNAQQYGRMPQLEPTGVWLDWIPQGGITADVFDEEIYSCTGCSQPPHLPSIFL